MTMSALNINAQKGPSSHPGPGGNWPSTTPGKPSGGGRGNGPAKGK